jgi:xylose isomerase
MSTAFFGDIGTVEYEGPDSTNPLAFRWYDAGRVVLGTRVEDHVLAGHSFDHEIALAYYQILRGGGFTSDTADAKKLLAGEVSLEEIERRLLAAGTNPQPRSGTQELLENIVNRYV